MKLRYASFKVSKGALIVWQSVNLGAEAVGQIPGGSHVIEIQRKSVDEGGPFVLCICPNGLVGWIRSDFIHE